MPSPKISVLMPVYNAENYVSTAIDSILGQTFEDFEFIIVDDHSKDKSWEIIKSYAKKDSRIVPLRNDMNLRATKSLNRGLGVVEGKYMARMDADDWSYPDRLQKQYDFMESHPEVGVLGGAIEVSDKDLKVMNVRRYPTTDAQARKIIFRYSPFAHPATIWRMKDINKVEGYNERIPLSQDLDLYFRIGNICKFANLEDVVIKLRVHDDSSSITRGRYQEQFALYTRIKAFLEIGGYEMTFGDKLYNFLQMISMILIPPRIKFWLFNLLRSSK